MDRIEKNKIISEARKVTKAKRLKQQCVTLKFKVDQSSLSGIQKESVKMYFIEAKRIYNYILSLIKKDRDIFSLTYKDLNYITYLDKDGNINDYTIQYLKSSIVDEILNVMKESIKGLSASKKKGRKVGSLKFKSEYNSIRLRQYGVTHSIKGNRIKIQGIKKPIRVNGLKQLDKYKNPDYTTANLLYDGYDYYISLTCFIDKKNKITNDTIIGLDLGCSNTITTSDGRTMNVSIGESERLKGLQAKLVSQKKRSNNWYKTRLKIRKEYNRMNNRKNDLSNKIVHELSEYGTVVIQDDQFQEWHEDRKLSGTVQHSILGRVKSKLLRKDNVFVLDQWFPTTKHCFNCGTDVDMKLSQRTFKCPVCGETENRDIHAAMNMIEFYKIIQSAGTVDLKPGKKISYDKCKDLFRQEAPLSLATE